MTWSARGLPELPCDGCSDCGISEEDVGFVSVPFSSATSNCAWIIAPPGAATIELNVAIEPLVGFEAGLDFIHVSECDTFECVSPRPLISLDGLRSQYMVSSTTGIVTIQLQAGTNIQGSGTIEVDWNAFPFSVETCFCHDAPPPEPTICTGVVAEMVLGGYSSMSQFAAEMVMFKEIIANALGQGLTLSNVKIDDESECTNANYSNPETDCTCDWIRNNENTDGELYVGEADSYEECIDMVRAQCPWATIANLGGGAGGGDCWCQQGLDRTESEASAWESCFLDTLSAGCSTDRQSAARRDTFLGGRRLLQADSFVSSSSGRGSSAGSSMSGEGNFTIFIIVYIETAQDAVTDVRAVLDSGELYSVIAAETQNRTGRTITIRNEASPRIVGVDFVEQRLCAPSELRLLDGYLISFESLVELLHWMQLWIGDPADPTYLRPSDEELFQILDTKPDSVLDQCELGFASGWIPFNTTVDFGEFQVLRSRVMSIAPRKRGGERGCEFDGSERAEVYDATGLVWTAELNIEKISEMWWKIATLQRSPLGPQWEMTQDNSETNSNQLFLAPCVEGDDGP